MIKCPDLLKKRLDAKERQKEQKFVILFSALMFISGFVIAGLDFKYNWTPLPNVVVIISSVIFVLAYIFYAEVLRENTYLSRTIKVADEQKVVDTGLYGIVRHPMYTATIILFLAMPLILGSLIAFFIMLVYPILIGFRAINEEKFLIEELPGYEEYTKKVKYRFIPFIW